MGIFSDFNGPILYKDSNTVTEQQEQLRNCYENSSDEIKKQIEQDMKMLSYGIIGENNIRFELMNSFMPMLVLRDIHLEYEGLTAQIDYLVITKKVVFVIECKNLFGNIEVNSNGDFIRTIEFNGKKRREGIYSPITQNQRHLELLKKLRRDSKNNILTKFLFDKNFDENYKSIIVLANPKTIIEMKYAKKDVKEKIIRNDQLIAYIKKVNKESKIETSSDKHMYEMADWFISKHKPINTDYTKKYKEEIKPEEIVKENETIYNIEDLPIYKALKMYRLNKSIEEKVKAYYIYNNAQIEELIRRMPRSLAEIKVISGFGDVKCSKYGEDILNIINNHI